MLTGLVKQEIQIPGEKHAGMSGFHMQVVRMA